MSKSMISGVSLRGNRANISITNMMAMVNTRAWVTVLPQSSTVHTSARGLSTRSGRVDPTIHAGITLLKSVRRQNPMPSRTPKKMWAKRYISSPSYYINRFSTVPSTRAFQGHTNPRTRIMGAVSAHSHSPPCLRSSVTFSVTVLFVSS